MPVTTRDIGLSLANLIEGKQGSAYDDEGEETEAFEFDSIDVSDAHNPVVYVTTNDGGKRFRIRITAI